MKLGKGYEIIGTNKWMKEKDIIDFYINSFDFDRGEVHFSINDIIGNLDNIPGRDSLEIRAELKEEDVQRLCDQVLDDFKYKGKSIREWIEEITE